MIEIRDFSCAYNDQAKQLLQQINLSIPFGQFVAVIGPSGGGKSTLCFSVNGLIPNEIEGSVIQGSITVNGRNVQQTPPHELISIVGTVLQDPEWQLVRSTVQEELVFPLENLGMSPEQIDHRLERVLDQIDVRPLLHRSPLELSGGQKQLVAIAGCLMLEPKVIVLDEPTAELDPLGKEMVIQTIRHLNKKWNYTVIFVDHNLDVTLPYADRVLVIEEGKLIADSHPSRLYETEGLERLPMPQVVEIAKRMKLKVLRENLASDPLTVTELLNEMLRTEAYPVKHNHSKAQSVMPSNKQAPIQPLIELKKVSFAYRSYNVEELALKSVDFTVRQGEFVALIGQNGSGKTTLCKLITGLLKPDGGEIIIRGKAQSSYRANEMIQSVGYVFQNPDYQLFKQTVYDEIAFGLKLQKLGKAEITSRVEEVASLLQIDRHLKEHPHFLSRGERRRVAIASILALRPAAIILDEPTTGLDGLRCRLMMDYIQMLWKKGVTILLLTHDMRVVADYVPRTVVMSKGTIMMDDTTESVFSRLQELRQCRITPPPVVQLTSSLGWTVPALTADQFVERMVSKAGHMDRFQESELL
ncbi:ABC transporter ATP-binding protein [Metabacillus arenae]|uniref:ABC transporter ATP-binding protein n=1 Tax=Metabacillus arenae TaxID=2771434 RepID=A0A926RZP0_9BACI|nr:energy-coupling factor transporter ATPase [Metabacillus arenae]MBD1382457.1 ABC transporter ATP-binding protein [Metabacillus arenae]